jgi:hypothetical protein
LKNPLLNIITPVSRPQNLAQIRDSLRLLDPYFTVRWLLALDDKYASPADVTVEADTIISVPHGATKGDAQRNAAMPFIEDGWVYCLDDDTVIHPDFAATARRHIDQSGKRCLVFSQVNRDGTQRLDTTRVYLGEIDTGSFLLHSSVIRNANWRACPHCPNGEAGDYMFINDIFNEYPSEFIFTREFVTYYNAI